MNVMFTLDRNYLDILKTCIRSFTRFRTPDGYDVYILHSDFTDADIEGLNAAVGAGARLHYIYVEPSLFDKFPDSMRYPKTIYYRIFAAKFLPDTMDRVLYLDPDTVVINPLDELYNMEFNGNYYIACSHTKDLLNQLNSLRLGVLENRPYINTGVMMMNLEKLRAEQSEEDVLEYISKKERIFFLPDQDIITALYGDKTIIVDEMKYNLSDRILALRNTIPGDDPIDLEWIEENTVIIHYCGRNKPWNKDYHGALDYFYKELSD